MHEKANELREFIRGMHSSKDMVKSEHKKDPENGNNHAEHYKSKHAEIKEPLTFDFEKQQVNLNNEVKPSLPLYAKDFQNKNEGLEQIHENKIRMRGGSLDYYILGQLNQDLSRMSVTMMIEERNTKRKERIKIDLYEREFLSNFAHHLAERFTLSHAQVEAELLLLTDLLEQYREGQIETSRPDYQSKKSLSILSPENRKIIIDFLSQPGFISKKDEMLEIAGVIGEVNNRKLLLVLASTFKMSHPLHVLVKGGSGSGKSHLINTIGQCFPPEDVLSITRISSKSLYHFTRDELVDKLILIQDFDGLDKEAVYAFRELQSSGKISSSITYKNPSGKLISILKNVNSNFSSLSATTRSEIHLDNVSRPIIIGVDESEEQTRRIIEHQNKRLAGLIDQRDERNAKKFLQDCMRCLKSYEVVNRYVDKVYLPMEAKMLRRLNSHYQAFVKQITILHQYQRQDSSRNRKI